MNSHTLIGPVKLFGSAWSFYKKHWKSLTTLVILPIGAIFIGNLISQIGSAIGDGSPSTGVFLEIAGLVIFLAGGVFMVAAMSGLMNAIHRLAQEPAHVFHAWSQYKLGFRYFWPLVLIAIIRALSLLGASMVFVIPGIILSVYTMFVMYSLVIDGKRGLDAFADSFTLVYKRWWKVLGRILFMGVCYMAAVFVVTGIAFIPRLIFRYGIASIPHTIVNSVLMIALVLVFVPMIVTYLYQLFAALKSTRVDSPRAAAFKNWLIAFMVIGALAIVATIVFGSFFDRYDRGKRLRYDSTMAVTNPPITHGSLVD